MAKLIEVSVISLVLLSMCLAVSEGVKLGGACTEQANCTTVTYSDCSGSPPSQTCKCDDGYMANTGNNKCLAKVNGTCTATADCLPNGNCTNQLCRCNMNFHPADNGTKCNVATALTTSFILLMAAILVSRFFAALGLENVI